jgi:hypothetical protein
VAIYLDGLYSVKRLDSANPAIIATGRNVGPLEYR